MIGKLSGVVDSLDEDGIILDVNGVGYLVAASARTLRTLPPVGQPAALLIETQVREDAIRLYGFLTAGERDWFRLLQSVQGVGAKVALGILGALTADALSAAIARQDKAMMARAPGVGPKLAARLVLELKDKAPALGGVDFGGAGVDSAPKLAQGGRRRDPCARRPRLCATAGRRRHRQMLGSARRRRTDGGADPGCAQGSGAMSGENGARRPVLSLIGLVLLFAALGPAVGGALFFPLAVILKPPIGADTLALSALVAALFGHTIALIASYVVGVGPAAATGFLYGLWDAAVPDRWPRALVAAFIGGAVAYGVLLRLAAIGGSAHITIEASSGVSTADWIDAAFSSGVEGALAHAFVACGAVAGLVCAMAASLFGLTMRPAPPSQSSGAV